MKSPSDLTPNTKSGVTTDIHGITVTKKVVKTKINDMAKKKKETRFTVRKRLFWRRRTANDFACIFALLGFILMVVDREMTLHNTYERDDTESLIVKLFISVTTVITIGFVLLYHMLNIQLYMFLHSIKVIHMRKSSMSMV